jgi:hypothetical protein
MLESVVVEVKVNSNKDSGILNNRVLAPKRVFTWAGNSPPSNSTSSFIPMSF